jgi:RNA polymerase sigma-70 factor (ECF subfamily)
LVFDEVFSSLWPALLALARRLLGDGIDAEDVAQEALLRVLGRADEYDPGRDALTWAFAITAFEVQTLRKKRARRRETGREPVHLPSSAATPEQSALDAELRLQLAAAVDMLSDSDREEIERYLGLAERASGGALGDAERKRRQRAISRLKQIWRSLHGFHP